MAFKNFPDTGFSEGQSAQWPFQNAVEATWQDPYFDSHFFAKKTSWPYPLSGVHSKFIRSSFEDRSKVYERTSNKLRTNFEPPSNKHKPRQVIFDGQADDL